MKLKKLGMLGATHIILPLLVVVGAGVIGTAMLVASHADAASVPVCSVTYTAGVGTSGDRLSSIGGHVYANFTFTNAGSGETPGTNGVITTHLYYAYGLYYSNTYKFAVPPLVHAQVYRHSVLTDAYPYKSRETFFLYRGTSPYWATCSVHGYSTYYMNGGV